LRGSNFFRIRTLSSSHNGTTDANYKNGRAMNKIIAAVLALSLAACAAPPTADQLTAADFGRHPAGYREIIKGYMGRTLKDPESARYEFVRGPAQAWTTLGGLKVGWGVCANINAKNSFGGYTGSRLSYFLIHNDAVVAAHHTDARGYGLAEGMCKRLGLD
jgi:hypothetical protein